MTSPTYGNVEMKRIAEIISEEIRKTDGEYNIVIGTDSQNFSYTKVVCVIALHHVGHGGIFFYDILNVKKITDVAQKIRYETQLSLEYAENLLTELEKIKEKTGYNTLDHAGLCIHVDAGKNGKSRQVIPEIVGWIQGCGYNVAIKPDSFAASGIANRISK